MYRFSNRSDAGQELARRLMKYQEREGLLVLALPRGGVPVGYEVAKALGAEFDVLLVRKLGVPGYEELAMGAIASGGIRVINESVMRMLNVSESEVEEVARSEEEEMRRREREYRDDRRPPSIVGRTVMLIDDGLATGSTMRAAAQAVRQQKPAELVIAVPVGAKESCAELQSEADSVICLMTPEPFDAVGLWYEDFRPTSDQEVRELLEGGRRFAFHEDTAGDRGDASMSE